MHHTPAHVHNLFLNTLFERGLIGFGALMVFLAALAQAAWRKRDLALLAVFSAVLIINLFDTTLFYSGVIYPLAAVAGWRAATYRRLATNQRDLSRQMVVGLVLPLSDYLVAALAFVMAVGSYNLANHLFGFSLGGLGLLELWAVAGYALLLWPAMFWREGLYPGYGLSAPQQLKRQVMGALYAGLILAAGTVFFNELSALPRSILVLSVLYSMGLSPFGRHLTKALLHHAGLWGRPVVVLGAGRTGARIAKALLGNPLEGLMPVAFFDDDPSRQGSSVHGLPVVGSLSDANRYAERHDLHHAIVAIPKVSSEVLSELIGRKGRSFKQVQFVPDLAGLPSADVYASSLDEMLALEVRNGLHSERNRFFKRVLDLLGCFFATLISLPLLLLLYLWIRLDSRGPAFYRSERLGQDGKAFYCLKFRSMYLDAETRLKGLLKDDPALRAEYEEFHKLENDPRVTRAGSVLRKYSLDELPQLYNVWLGEMSLVGPRPYLVRELPDMVGYSETILEAKPGMTGHWQVSGRNAFTFQERLEMESHYVRNWSIWWDMLILVKTVVVVLSRRGAK